MSAPGSLDAAAEDLTAGAEESIRCIIHFQTTQQPDHFVRRDGAVCVQKSEPFGIAIQIPTRIDGSTLSRICGDAMKANQRTALAHTFLHPMRIVLPRTIVDYCNPQRTGYISKSPAQGGKIVRQAAPFIVCGNHQMD